MSHNFPRCSRAFNGIVALIEAMHALGLIPSDPTDNIFTCAALWERMREKYEKL